MEICFAPKFYSYAALRFTAATLLAATLTIMSADLGQILAVITAHSVADNQQN
jgi:hypothetical protein